MSVAREAQREMTLAIADFSHRLDGRRKWYLQEALYLRAQATSGEPRPEGMTALQAVTRMLDEQQRHFFGAAARAAMACLIEQADALAVITDKAKRHAVVAGEVVSVH